MPPQQLLFLTFVGMANSAPHRLDQMQIKLHLFGLGNLEGGSESVNLQIPSLDPNIRVLATGCHTRVSIGNMH